MRLLTRYQNSAGQRIRTALALKEIDYEYVSIAEMGSEAYRALNPQGLMPALAVETVCMALPAFQEATPERQQDYPG